AHRTRRDCVRSDDRRSESVHASVEDEHAALPASGEERADHGLQVRGVRRGVGVRSVAQEAARQMSAEHHMRDRLFTAVGVLAITVVVSGQTKKASAPSRLAGGHPDLTGTYDLAMLTPLERPAGMPAVLSDEE